MGRSVLGLIPCDTNTIANDQTIDSDLSLSMAKETIETHIKGIDGVLHMAVN